MGYYFDPTGLIVGFVIAFGLAFIPSTIAKRKGASGVGFWFFGFFLFLIALIVAIAMKDRTVQQQPQVVVVQQPQAPPPRYVPPPPPRQKAPPPKKNCAYCGSLMAHDAEVCNGCGAKATR